MPHLADEVERELVRATGRAESGAILDPPSTAELTVLRLLASDLSTREIGGQLFLSPNTIRTHTRAIYRKLAVTLTRGRRRPRRGAGPSPASGITHVIEGPGAASGW